MLQKGWEGAPAQASGTHGTTHPWNFVGVGCCLWNTADTRSFLQWQCRKCSQLICSLVSQTKPCSPCCPWSQGNNSLFFFLLPPCIPSPHPPLSLEFNKVGESVLNKAFFRHHLLVAHFLKLTSVERLISLWNSKTWDVLSTVVWAYLLTSLVIAWPPALSCEELVS